MYFSSILIAIIFIAFNVTISSAQELRYDLPQAEHNMLQRFAGDWQFERLSVPEDESEPKVLGKGTISAEMVGDFFVESRWTGDIYGFDYKAYQSLGYDIEQKKYTGYWIDSFMSFRWKLSGDFNEEGQEFILSTHGPSPTGGTTNFRERYKFDSEDLITIIGEMQQGENWVKLSKTKLTR